MTPPASFPDRLRLRSGETSQLRLPGLGTAGYGWQCTVEGDAGAVTIERSSAPLEAMPGYRPQTGNRDEVLVVRGVSPGRVRLVLELRRPWEAAVPPLERREVSVEVDAPPRP